MNYFLEIYGSLPRAGPGSDELTHRAFNMIDRVKANAERAGASSRLETIVQDMKEMAFPASSFDVIWSEGAIYNLGFETGLRKFRKLVKPGGYVVVSDAVWLKSNPPQEVVEFWQEYPEIDTVDAKLKVIERRGFEIRKINRKCTY